MNPLTLTFWLPYLFGVGIPVLSFGIVLSALISIVDRIKRRDYAEKMREQKAKALYTQYTNTRGLK